MPNWRNHVLSELTPDVHRLTLVDDPDGLLTDESLQVSIRERGFELQRFEDAITFRYAYESRFRARWDQGVPMNLVVMLGTGDVDSLPFDILNAGHRVTVGLGTLFPTLSRAVIADLGVAHLDALWNACERHRPRASGENATKDFALHHVYGIVPEAIVEPQDLLRVLLRRHYAELRIPPSIDERLVQLLRQHGEFSAWPLEAIVPNRTAFLGFLQERWPVFLDQVAGSDSHEHSAEAIGSLSFPGPALLPFDHADIRVYIDNLFVEEHLHAVQHPSATSFPRLGFGLACRWMPSKPRRIAWSGYSNELPHRSRKRRLDTPTG